MSPPPRSRSLEATMVAFMMGLAVMGRITPWPPQHTVDWVLLVFEMLASSAAVRGTTVMRWQRRGQHERRSEVAP